MFAGFHSQSQARRIHTGFHRFTEIGQIFITNTFLIKTFQVEILKMVWTIVSNFQALEIIMIIIRQFVRLHPRRMELATSWRARVAQW